MNTYRYTKVWNINGQLVVADTVEDALKVYRSTYNSYVSDIREVIAVNNGNTISPNYDVLISNESK